MRAQPHTLVISYPRGGARPSACVCNMTRGTRLSSQATRMRSLCLLSVHILTLRDCCSAAHLQMIGSVQVVLRIRALDRAKVASSISSAMPHGASAKVSDIPAACGALPPSLPRHPRVPAFMLRARTLTAAYRKPMLNTASEGEHHLCHPKRAARSPPQVHITGPSGAARAEDALAAARVAEKKSYADAALKAVKVSGAAWRDRRRALWPHRSSSSDRVCVSPSVNVVRPSVHVPSPPPPPPSLLSADVSGSVWPLATDGH